MNKNRRPRCNKTHANSLKRFSVKEKERVGFHHAEFGFLPNSSAPQTALVISQCLVEMRLAMFSEIDWTVISVVLRISDGISSHGFAQADKINSDASFTHPVSLPARFTAVFSWRPSDSLTSDTCGVRSNGVGKVRDANTFKAFFCCISCQIISGFTSMFIFDRPMVGKCLHGNVLKSPGTRSFWLHLHFFA